MRLILALAIALVPADALAARVAYEPPTRSGSEVQGDPEIVGAGVVRFTGAPGEANDVEVSGGPTVFRFTDAVPLEVGPGCTRVDERTAECSRGYPELDLGDGDDRARCAVGLCVVRGDAGDDVIEALAGTMLQADGGDGQDVLRGHDRDDSLEGGAGADVLTGAGGSDQLFGDPVGLPYAADRLDGGGGTDLVSYGGRTTSVRAELGVGGGGPGEDDVIVGVESLSGGTAADVLIGDGGPNGLSGDPYTGGGDEGDRLVGRGGDDALVGTRGADALEGGEGDDVLRGLGGSDRYRGGAGADRLVVTDGEFVRRYRQAELSCGPGADRVFGPSPEDRIARACESVRLSSVVLTRLAGPLAFRVQPVASPHRCRATLHARSGGRHVWRRFLSHRGNTLRFPRLRGGAMTLRFEACAGRRARLVGGFRVSR